MMFRCEKPNTVGREAMVTELLSTILSERS